jgi:hypothetical protein
MLKKIFVFYFCCFLGMVSSAQKNNPCFEVRYLDFFGLEMSEPLKWPDTELDKLLSDSTFDNSHFTRVKTNFLIPLIIVQLQQYHPNCNTINDTATYAKLIKLYRKIRQLDFHILDGKQVVEQLDILRTDFYAQVNDDSLLPYMKYTLDDGPFTGQLSKYIPDYSKGEKHNTAFGSFIITKHAGKIFMTVINKESKHLWSRVLTRNQNQLLSELVFHPDQIEHTSLGYTLTMTSLGEALTLYLRENGDFRYYFHSW